jgi:ATP-binding cassette, subfamily B, bacterial
VLILDEPTTGLHAASADRLLTVIRRFAAGHTAIVITHDPRVAAAAADVLRRPASTPAPRRTHHRVNSAD